MRLVSLTLTNFKGVRELPLMMAGHDFIVLGDNGTGKTTVADAYTWLLFGKDSQGRTDFEIKTIDRNTGETLSRLDHSVEGVFALESGKELTLKRTYRESWGTKRGSQDTLMGGHETDYEINGVPVKKTEYDARVAGLCDPTLFRALSEPGYFCASLAWKKRREMLLDVCGDVTPDQVVEREPSLKPVLALLDERTYDEAYKVAKANKDAASDARKDIGPRLEELNRDRPEERPGTIDLDPLRAKVTALQEKRSTMLSGGAAAPLRQQIAETSAKMAERKTTLMQAGQSEWQAALEKVNGLSRDLSVAESVLMSMDIKLDSDADRLEKLRADCEKARAEYAEISAEKWEWNPGAEDCPTCGQKLPVEDLEAKRQAASQAWHESLANRKAANIEFGEKLVAEITGLDELLSTNRSKRDEKLKTIEALKESIATAKEEADALKPTTADPSTDPEYVGLASMLAKQQAELSALESDSQTATAEIDAEIKAAQDVLLAGQQVNLQADQYDITGRRIAELEAEDKTKAEALEQAHNDMFLLERYVRAKVSLLTEQINSNFETVRWKLFDDQINGGLAECCECTVDGVPYGSLNHGMRINAGLDVIETLSTHYRFAPPILIDNAESITQIAPTTGQQIRMVVSADDKSLRYATA